MTNDVPGTPVTGSISPGQLFGDFVFSPCRKGTPYPAGTY